MGFFVELSADILEPLMRVLSGVPEMDGMVLVYSVVPESEKILLWDDDDESACSVIVLAIPLNVDSVVSRAFVRFWRGNGDVVLSTLASLLRTDVLTCNRVLVKAKLPAASEFAETFSDEDVMTMLVVTSNDGVVLSLPAMLVLVGVPSNEIVLGILPVPLVIKLTCGVLFIDAAETLLVTFGMVTTMLSVLDVDCEFKLAGDEVTLLVAALFRDVETCVVDVLLMIPSPVDNIVVLGTVMFLLLTVLFIISEVSDESVKIVTLEFAAKLRDAVVSDNSVELRSNTVEGCDPEIEE
jgi:hypothetical protein